jgi:hypothetical protein
MAFAISKPTNALPIFSTRMDPSAAAGTATSANWAMVMVPTNLDQLDGAVARLLGVGPSAESVFFVINDDQRALRTGSNDARLESESKSKVR